MKEQGRFLGAELNLRNRKLVVKFEIDDTERVRAALDMLQGKDLVISAKKVSGNRSLTANKYLWYLADEIAKALKSDKWTVYLLQLSKYGVFTDVDVIPEALPLLQREFRYIEKFDDGYEDGEKITVRCYYGSSGYNTKEMSDLLEGTVRDAQELGIDTITPDERRHLYSLWQSQLCS